MSQSKRDLEKDYEAASGGRKLGVFRPVTSLKAPHFLAVLAIAVLVILCAVLVAIVVFPILQKILG